MAPANCYLFESNAPGAGTTKDDMDNLLDLEAQMRALHTAIIETRKRLPAHSVKPPVMMDLLDLEDQYDALLKRFIDLKEKQCGNP